MRTLREVVNSVLVKLFGPESPFNEASFRLHNYLFIMTLDKITLSNIDDKLDSDLNNFSNAQLIAIAMELCSHRRIFHIQSDPWTSYYARKMPRPTHSREFRHYYEPSSIERVREIFKNCDGRAVDALPPSIPVNRIALIMLPPARRVQQAHRGAPEQRATMPQFRRLAHPATSARVGSALFDNARDVRDTEAPRYRDNAADTRRNNRRG